MYQHFNFLLLWGFFLALAKTQELEDMALHSNNDPLNLDLDSNVNSIPLDSNDNNDATSSSPILGAYADTLEASVQKPNDWTDDTTTSDLTRSTLTSGEATPMNDGPVPSNDGTLPLDAGSISSNDETAPLNNVETPSKDGITPQTTTDIPAQPYTVAELGESLFDPAAWLARGVETLWSVDSAILQTGGDIIRRGAIWAQGVTIYFVQRKPRKTHRRTRKINGEKKEDGTSVSNQELQNALTKLQCPDLGNRYPLTKVCRTRQELPKHKYSVGWFANHVRSVIPVFTNGGFNPAIFDIWHLQCYCCRAMFKSLDGTRYEAKGCQVVMYT